MTDICYGFAIAKMRALALKTKWRLLIFLVVSVGCHLALLRVQLQHDMGNLAGEQYVVGQITDNLDHFAPQAPEIDRISSVTKEAVDRPLFGGRSSQTEILTVKPLPVLKPIVQPSESPLLPESNKVAESPVLTAAPRLVAVAGQAETSSKSGSDVVADTLLGQAVVPRGEQGGFGADSVAIEPPLTRAVPRYADNPKPTYPDVARRKGWAGEVRLLVRVDDVGLVAQVSVVGSSGYSALDRAARRAVRLWRFIPATEAGRKVTSEVVVPIAFRLPVSAEGGVLAHE